MCGLADTPNRVLKLGILNLDLFYPRIVLNHVPAVK